ncbi:hypothetical protein ACA910_006785 [Epithemia clementina (nom. ined.)]
MRFRAKLANDQVSLLYSLVTSIARLTSASGSSSGDGTAATAPLLSSSSSSSSSLVRNGCMLFLDQDHVRFSVRGGHRNDAAGVTCFVELEGRSLFVEPHRIESIAERNGILMELDIVQLRMALQSIQQQQRRDTVLANTNSTRHRKHQSTTTVVHDDNDNNYDNNNYVIWKLSKRNQTPCLCLDTGGTMEVHHAIPVRLSRASDMQHHLPPSLPLPQIQLEWPVDTTPLRTVLERVRYLSPTVYLTASSHGQLTLKTHTTTSGVALQIILDRLIPRMESCQKKRRSSSRQNQPRSTHKRQKRNGVSNEENSHKDDDSEDDKEGGPRSDHNDDNHNDNDDQDEVECTVKVDTKKLALCLQWQGGQPHQGASVSSSSSFSLASTALLCWVENEALVLHVLLNPSHVGFFTYYIPVHFLSASEDEDDNNDENE